MQAFNLVNIDLPNVLWLNDSEKMRCDGARFAHSLVSNDLVTDFTAVDRLGYVSSKAARAALRFSRHIKAALVPEHVDLTDPKKPEKPSTSADLQEVHYGKFPKNRHESHRYEPTSARGAPFKRGGGGGRGQPWNNNRR